MINHYTLDHTKKEIEEHLSISLPNDFHPIYNASIKTALPIITKLHRTEAKRYNWGIIPQDANDPQIASKLCVANSKTINAKKPYCDLIKNKRCIIIADSFFFTNNNRYYRVTTKNKTPFGIAGLYEQSGEQEDGTFMFKSFAMIQCEASLILSDKTSLMPAILPKDMYDIWLSNSEDGNALQNLLKPYSNEIVDYYEVSNKIANPEINNVSTITPIGETPTGQSLELF